MGRMLFAVLLATAMSLVPANSGVLAQQSPPDPMPSPVHGTAFADWGKRHGIVGGVMLAARDGVPTHTATIGNAAPRGRYLLASLSKAITAVCIATLVEDGTLTWKTPLKTALAKQFAQHGAPDDARIEGITIEQLITHHAGFPTRPDDVLTPRTLATFLKDHTAQVPQIQALLAATFSHRLAIAPGSRFAYSNAGYLALGAIIEEATGLSYEEACRTRVLAPLGVTDARLFPKWAVLSSYAGWSMPIAEYVRFMQVFAPDHPLLGERTRHWLAELATRARRAGDAGWYGLGVHITRSTAIPGYVSHTGSWPWHQDDAKDGLLVASIGSYAVRYDTGETVITVFWHVPHNSSAREPIYADLIRSIHATLASRAEHR